MEIEEINDNERQRISQESMDQVGLMQVSLMSSTYALNNMFSDVTCLSLDRLLLAYQCLIKNMVFMMAHNRTETVKEIEKEIKKHDEALNDFLDWIKKQASEKEFDKQKH